MRAVTLLAVAALGLSACAASPTAAPGESGPTSIMSEPMSSTPPAAGSGESSIPDIWQFSAQRLGGGEVVGESFTGKKVAVWLWAPWCGPCGRLAPEVAKAAKAHPGITFLGVPGQDSDDAHLAFVTEHGLEDITHAIDERRQLWGHFGSATQEAWLFIEEDGTIMGRTRYGEMSPEVLENYLVELEEA